METKSLSETLSALTRDGELYEALPDGRIRCFACGHRCPIPEGKAGVCKVRFNAGGRLRVPYGYVAALQDDPIEKKPFYHALPGSRALSFGMLGCDFHCSYCQNWITSQALRDPEAGAPAMLVTPEKIVELALIRGCKIVTSTYNEPLITSEWAVAVFKKAREAGLVTSFVSNGNATPEVLDYLQPWVDLYKVDLKSFDERHYRELGGTLENVCRTIVDLHRRGIWLEVVTLLIPGFNDSEEELTALTRFLASVSLEIPWHVTAYHQDYKMTENENTRPEHLLRAAEAGRKAGLKFIYPGNLPGRVGKGENTYCPQCDELLIERLGFNVLRDELSASFGKCFACGYSLPGFWRKK